MDFDRQFYLNSIATVFCSFFRENIPVYFKPFEARSSERLNPILLLSSLSNTGQTKAQMFTMTKTIRKFIETNFIRKTYSFFRKTFYRESLEL
jgi:hypothetical protein